MISNDQSIESIISPGGQRSYLFRKMILFYLMCLYSIKYTTPHAHVANVFRINLIFIYIYIPRYQEDYPLRVPHTAICLHIKYNNANKLSTEYMAQGL